MSENQIPTKPARKPTKPKSTKCAKPAGLHDEIAPLRADVARDIATLRADVVTELEPALGRIEERLQTIEALLRQIHGPAPETLETPIDALLRKIRGPAAETAAAGPDALPYGQCKTCGGVWRSWKDIWQHVAGTPLEKCCDNAPMELRPFAPRDLTPSAAPAAPPAA